MIKQRWIIFFLMTLMGLVGCSDDKMDKPGGTNGSDGDADSDSDGDADISWDDYVGDADSDGLLETVCPDGANHPETCFCLRIGVVGIFDSTANDDDKDVSQFVDWLNNDSSAIVRMVNASSNAKPTIDADFLDDYDMLLFLYQASGLHSDWWTYSASEAAALKKWIEAGGGIVTVTGFNGQRTGDEVAAINSILKPATGISYNNDQILSQCASNKCYCWGNVPELDGFDPDHPISHKVSSVGALIGSSISAPANAEIVAKSSEGNLVVAVEIGEGRAVAIADEWPLFSQLWEDQTDPSTMPGYNPDETTWQYQDCYDSENEYWLSVDRKFQVPQFWYNVIDWASPENECFHIDHPLIEVE
ncbi:MAG: hypothetical protein JXX14_13930 [Deltaproteobacteria bacterium]|nr:hypothetical protein [Deltaproteobacteria bacterium]